MTPEELQESIYAFAFDLVENQKGKTITGPPLNYFMGILRKVRMRHRPITKTLNTDNDGYISKQKSNSGNAGKKWKRGSRPWSSKNGQGGFRSSKGRS